MTDDGVVLNSVSSRLILTCENKYVCVLAFYVEELGVILGEYYKVGDFS